MFTVVADLSDQAQISQSCIADRLGRSRQTVSKWLQSTVKTRLCQLASVMIDRFMKIRNLTCAAVFNPHTRRTELFKVYEGKTYQMGCYIYRVSIPALNKRALKKTIRYRMARRDQAVVDGGLVNADAYNTPSGLSQDGGL